MPTVTSVVAALEEMFPPSLAEDWDTPGLAVGDPDREVTLVHFAVDPTLEVAREAVAAGAQLLVTHHPLMLRGATTVAATTAHGAVVHALIEGGCALFAAHTNADAATPGVSEALASALGVKGARALVPDAGTGAVAAPGVGTGRIGSIEAITLAAFAQLVADALPDTVGGVLFAGDPDGVVETVALVAGSGGEFLSHAIAQGADVFVTADLRHHPTTDARQLAQLSGGKPYLVNVSHAASESLWLDAAAAALATATGVTATVSRLNTDPWVGSARRSV